MKQLLKGGSVVSGDGVVTADVLLDGETISAVGQDLRCSDAQIIDLSGHSIPDPAVIEAYLGRKDG